MSAILSYATPSAGLTPYRNPVWSPDMQDGLTDTTGDRVRKALREAGVTQVKAGSAIGISQSQLSRRLAGQIGFRVTEIATLAALAQVPVSSLIAEPVSV